MQPRASGKRMRFKYAKCYKSRQIDTQTWQSSIVSGGQPAGGIRTHSSAPAPARQHQHLQASGDARRVSGVRAAVCVARSRLRCLMCCLNTVHVFQVSSMDLSPFASCTSVFGSCGFSGAIVRASPGSCGFIRGIREITGSHVTQAV